MAPHVSLEVVKNVLHIPMYVIKIDIVFVAESIFFCAMKDSGLIVS